MATADHLLCHHCDPKFCLRRNRRLCKKSLRLSLVNGRQMHGQRGLIEGKQIGQQCTEVCPSKPGSCEENPVKQKDVVVFQQNGSVS